MTTQPGFREISLLGCIDILFEMTSSAGDEDCAGEGGGVIAVSGGETAELFELIEAAFDAVS